MAKSKIRKFWCVWQPEHGVPTYKHDTLASAKEEASRLARANPGQSFYVLQVKMEITKHDVEVIDFDELPDDIPF